MSGPGLRRVVLCLAVLALASCGLATGPPGQASPGGNFNPLTRTRAGQD